MRIARDRVTRESGTLQKLEGQINTLQYVLLSAHPATCTRLSLSIVKKILMHDKTVCCLALCTLPLPCRAALAAQEEQYRLCQRACEAAEAAYGEACCRIYGGEAFLQAQQCLQAWTSQIMQVAFTRVTSLRECSHVFATARSHRQHAHACKAMLRAMHQAQAQAERRHAELELKRARSQTAAVQKATADMDTKASSAKGVYAPREPFPASQED